MTPMQELAYRKLAGNYPDPVHYGREWLGRYVTPQQAAIAARLSEPPYRVLCPSANNVGKTFAVGWLINWFHDRYDPGIVLSTSSGFTQVCTQVFKEVRRQRPFALGLQPRAPAIQHTPEHFVLGFSTNKPDSFQGHHENNLFLTMDEGTGVDPEFADRAETMFQRRPGHAWLVTYNPNDSTTWPYAAEMGGDWHVVRLSALEHPNIEAELRGEPPPVPAAIRLERVVGRILKECEYLGDEPEDETSFLWPPEVVRARLTEPRGGLPQWGWYKPLTDLFEVQVLGKWPSKSQSGVWSSRDVERCKVKVGIDEQWPVQLGCDMARDGRDKICIAVRKGIVLIHLEELVSSTKSQVVADRLRELCYKYAPSGTPPREIPVLVDDTGGYGAGVVDYPEGHNFIGIKNSNTAQNPDLYPNVRSELWWSVKIAADERGFVLGSCAVGASLIPKLEAELTAARYALDFKSRRVIAGKDSMKAVLKRSPDYADAVCLAWYPVAH